MAEDVPAPSNLRAAKALGRGMIMTWLILAASITAAILFGWVWVAAGGGLAVLFLFGVFHYSTELAKIPGHYADERPAAPTPPPIKPPTFGSTN
jgi:hypothetical protein